jgi:EmrB/QacA subfamily drug resistance transporter
MTPSAPRPTVHPAALKPPKPRTTASAPHAAVPLVAPKPPKPTTTPSAPRATVRRAAPKPPTIAPTEHAAVPLVAPKPQTTASTSRTSVRRPRVRRRPAARPKVATTAMPVRSVSTSRPRLALAVLTAGAMLAVLDAGLLGAGIPSMRAAFGASTDQARWVAGLYTVALGMALPVSGWLSARLGAARLHRLALIAFIATSALCAVAWNLGSLLGLRVLQGASAGVLLAVSVSLLCRTTSRARWGTAMGVLGLGLLLAPAIGPALVAWPVAQAEWRLLPLAGLPAGLLVLGGSWLALPGTGAVDPRRLDPLRTATAAVVVGSMLLALSGGAGWGWGSPGVLSLACLAILGLALLAVLELSELEPSSLDLRRIRWGSTVLPLVLCAVPVAALAAGFFEVPLLLQGGAAGGAQAGVTLLLPAALAGAAMIASGRLADRAGARWPAAAGLVLVACATYLLHGVPQTATGRLVALASLRSLGLGLAATPLLASAMAAAAAERAGRAIAVTAACVVVPAAVGLAVLSSALTPAFAGRGAPGAATTVQGRLVLLHGDATLPLVGGTFLHVVLLTAAVCALGALLAMRLPGGARQPQG